MKFKTAVIAILFAFAIHAEVLYVKYRDGMTWGQRQIPIAIEMFLLVSAVGLIRSKKDW